MVSSYTTRTDVMKKLGEIKWEQQFANIEVAVHNLVQPNNNPMNQTINIPNIKDILEEADVLNSTTI